MSDPSADAPAPHRGRSVAALTAISALSAVSPLLALPLVARAAGAEGFFNIATGQAIGTLAATLILFGWNIAGPVRAARTSSPAAVFWESAAARGLNGVVVLPVVAAVAVLATSSGDAALTVFSALAFALQGYSIAWYAVGSGRPALSLVFDTLPRLVANLAGGVLALALAAPLAYPLTLLGLSVVAWFGFLVTVARSAPGAARGTWRRAMASYRTQWRPATTTALLTFSETAPMTTLGVSGSPAAVGFAPFDRVLKYGYIGVYMIANSFQGWVASAPGELGLRRMRRATALHGALALVLGLGFALLAPWAVPVVLGPGFAIAPATAAAGGVALATMTLTTVLGVCVLLPAGRDRAYLTSVAVGAVLVVPAVLLGAAAGGVTGAASAVAVVQLGMLATMLAPALRALRPATQPGPRESI